ncbi:MAG: aminopeptidase [Burkholderiales bacterium]
MSSAKIAAVAHAGLVQSFPRFAAIAAGLIWLGGCQTLGYYTQAVGGQFEIWRASRPVESWVRDERTEQGLRERLKRVIQIRDFASRELALPDNGSYRKYADLQRPFVVWNVFAAPELSLEPVRWCFPFAGCVAYRGYFARSDAERFGSGLRDKGFDVFVGGVPAYSTLGWFDDPLLNTFIRFPETEVARLIFHELAHQVAYARDDTMFNESFATTVELEGIHRWVQKHGTTEQREAFETAQQRKRDFLALVAQTRTALRDTYALDAPKAEKRAAKAVIFAAMRDEYAKLKQRWGGFAGYDYWFEEPLNNAKLVSVAAYSELVPAFQRLLKEKNGDLAAFYAEIKAIAKLPEAERRSRLGFG